MMKAATLMAAMLVVLGISSAYGQQEDVQVPGDVLKNFRYFVGTWKVEGRAEDKASEGEWSARWGQGRNCLIRQSWYRQEGETRHGSGIIGWDPQKERIAEYAFWTPNDSITIMWQLDPSGNLEGELKGTEGGVEVTASVKVTKNGPNEFVYESKNAAGDEIEAVFRKLPRKENGKSKD